MGRKNLRNKFLKEDVSGVEIVDISEDGRGIGKKNGEVFFIKGAVPGEVLDIEVYSKKKSVKEGGIVNIEKSSPLRVEPFCEHFGECGGCKWQHMSYPGQLFYKEKQVRDALERIAKIEAHHLKTLWSPILSSEETAYYRNKLEFTFSYRRWRSNREMKPKTSTKDPENMAGSEFLFDPSILNESHSAAVSNSFSPGLGFHVPGSFDKILDIDHCYLQKDPSNEIRLFVKQYCIDQNLPFFNLRDQIGLMRNLLIRTSSTGETMVIIVFAKDSIHISEVMESVHSKFPELTSLQYIINSKKNDTFLDQEVILFKGKDFIQEKMENLFFRVSAKSFYQTNSLQAYSLYREACRLANFSSSDLVYDLYTGTGTIANFMASQVRKVIGLEYVGDAVLDARKNSEMNNIRNTEFFTGDIKDLLSEDFYSLHGFPDVIITDPPRAGMHPEVVEALMKIKSPKVVYISCNPATQARDLVRLLEFYEITAVQPVDMFPQTQHVENIVLLQLKS